MEIKLSQKLTTNLVMTPQLQQAIRLLQLSRMELIDEVGRELEANPVLADDDVDPSPRGEREPLLPHASAGGEGEAGVDATGDRFDRTRDLGTRDQEKKAQEVDWEQFLENRTLQQPTYATKGGFEELPPIEQTLTRATSLHDHLLWQIQMSDFTDAERRFAEFIIGNLDERGYVDLSGMLQQDGTKEPDLTVEDIARAAELDPEDALEVLKMIQHFDPNGVASRDLRECLRIQAEIQGFDELELSIIDRHMHNLEKHNFQAIAKDLKVPLEDVYEAAKAIQTLESRPARNFTDG
jgi:RNA polymerase sigma-54 factor